MPLAAPSPAALSVTQLCRLLEVPEEKIQGHIRDGAPINADGTVNLVSYTAWLCLRLKESSGG